jgi:hypothetical protein
VVGEGQGADGEAGGGRNMTAPVMLMRTACLGNLQQAGRRFHNIMLRSFVKYLNLAWRFIGA